MDKRGKPRRAVRPRRRRVGWSLRRKTKSLPAPMVWTRTPDERRRRQVSWLAGRWAWRSGLPGNAPVASIGRSSPTDANAALAAYSCGHSAALEDEPPHRIPS